MSLLVILPSRGRPQQAKETLDTFIATRTLPDTNIVLVSHKSDPFYRDYKKLPCFVTQFDEGTTLTAKLNLAAAKWASEYDYIQFTADDIRYRTLGWDEIITSGMRERNAAFGYGNDLSRPDLANHVFADTRAVRALGWFALPTSKHLFLDDAWGAMGRELGTLVRFDSAVIEHLHPFYGKGDMDEGYVETNTKKRYDEDGEAFRHWLANSLHKDVEAIRKAMR